MTLTMIKGQLPIVLSSAQQITTDPVAVLGYVWVPNAATNNFQLDDNGNNILAAISQTVQNPAVPVFFGGTAIPCTGLSLKSIAGGVLYLYLASE
jgi:hypothetical protein